MPFVYAKIMDGEGDESIEQEEPLAKRRKISMANNNSNKQVKKYSIVMGYGGKHIDSKDEQKLYAVKILNAMKKMHSMSLFHRDLHWGNILFENKNQKFILLILKQCINKK